ncbi:MAG: hypothetical protein O9346_07145 [Leptospiraceae bacterium]|nr:hypothetical protein [Leptospiraceae bacterium]MCZ8346174.1 hypothetical protein [Leptospiraceae bacterium]
MFKNWILLTLLLFCMSLVTAKRIYSSKKTSSPLVTQVDRCHELCSSLESCSLHNSDLRIVSSSKEIGRACEVLCQKNHPNFQTCSPSLKCEALSQCIITGSAEELK